LRAHPVPSYVEFLADDHERVRRALQRLVEEQEDSIGELTRALEEYMDALDRKIVRAAVFRSTFGAGESQTVLAETDLEQASKPVTETSHQLEKERRVLLAYREALMRIDGGEAPHELLELASGEAS
jgi:HPt (histidine-containing phosphotransfer) domain-containing protein